MTHLRDSFTWLIYVRQESCHFRESFTWEMTQRSSLHLDTNFHDFLFHMYAYGREYLHLYVFTNWIYQKVTSITTEEFMIRLFHMYTHVYIYINVYIHMYIYKDTCVKQKTTSSRHWLSWFVRCICIHVYIYIYNLCVFTHTNTRTRHRGLNSDFHDLFISNMWVYINTCTCT